jgi:hypothetical protein
MNQEKVEEQRRIGLERRSGEEFIKHLKWGGSLAAPFFYSD